MTKSIDAHLLEFFNDHVMHSYKDFLNDKMNVYLARTACLYAHSFVEHYLDANLPAIKKFRESIGLANNSFNVIQAVANSTKHLIADNFSNGAREKGAAHFNDTQIKNDSLTFMSGETFHFLDGSEFSLLSSSIYFEDKEVLLHLEEVINYWRKELDLAEDVS